MITVPSDGSPPHLIPATYSATAHTITVSVNHLSGFWPAFLDFDSIARNVTDFLTQTTGLTTARLSCAGKPVSANGLTVAQAGDYGLGTHPPAWPCVNINGSTISVALTSDSPLPWRVRAAPNATLRPQGAIDPNSVALLAAYQTLVTKHPYAEGLLIPSETMTYQFDASNLPGSIQGKVDVGTWLAMDFLFAFTEAIDMFGINLDGIPDDADAIGCLGSAVTAASIGDTPSVAAVSGLAKAVLGCIGPVAKAAGGSLGVASVVIGILTSGVALVVGGIDGAIRTATGTDKFSIPITVSGGVTQVVRIRTVTAQRRLAAGYTVDKTITGDSQAFNPSGCQPGSEVVGAAYRCFGRDNGVYDPCWPDTSKSSRTGRDLPARPVVDTRGPDHAGPTRQPADPPDGPASSPTTDEPWGVRLTTGRECVAAQGTHDTYNGQVVDYFCGDNRTVLLRGVIRGSGRWTMASAGYHDNGSYSPGPIATITTAWYGLPTP